MLSIVDVYLKLRYTSKPSNIYYDKVISKWVDSTNIYNRSIEYIEVAKKYSITGLWYPFYINGFKVDATSFQQVVRYAFEVYNDFQILKSHHIYYSKQQLDFIESIIKTRKEKANVKPCN